MRNALIFTLIFCFVQTFGQKNWHLKDITDDGYPGISLDKAYKLLKDRKPKPVIVAILDSGVDTTQEDIKHFFWHNPNEIPNNGIDDDHNGFVDDVYGWNFLGNPKGENLDGETLEVTRLYGKLSQKYKNADTLHLTGNDKTEYELYKKVKSDYDNRVNKSKQELSYITKAVKNATVIENSLKRYLKKDTITATDLTQLETSDNDTLKKYAERYNKAKKAGFDLSRIKHAADAEEKKLNTELNPLFDARKIVGDNPSDKTDSIYGNNDVMGPSCGHGTFVAGIIAADRKNGNDAFGIADCVQIMVLRIVPGGDERDKDVANAIKYAVRNGANVLNMSFGKSYSPEKSMVDDALRLAAAKGVLCIHAAGNDAENNDEATHYPSPVGIDEKLLTTLWMDVGASGPTVDEQLAAPFSNYGKKSVDVFAPGIRIFSISPHNHFQSSNGTSASCPVVTGLAALLMSYFPELSAIEIKNIILASTVTYKNKVYLPGYSEENKKIKFKKLSKTGGIVNAEKAVKMAISLSNKKNGVR
jgi:subtilisin family serine protease